MTDEEAAYSVDVKIQRGNGTDDRDTLKATVSAHTLEELDERIEQMHDRLEDLAERTRAIQPDDTTARRLTEDQATLTDETGDDHD